RMRRRDDVERAAATVRRALHFVDAAGAAATEERMDTVACLEQISHAEGLAGSRASLSREHVHELARSGRDLEAKLVVEQSDLVRASSELGTREPDRIGDEKRECDAHDDRASVVAVLVRGKRRQPPDEREERDRHRERERADGKREQPRVASVAPQAEEASDERGADARERPDEREDEPAGKESRQAQRSA